MIAWALVAAAVAAEPSTADVVQPALAQFANQASDPEVSSAVRWIVMLTSLSVLPGVMLLMTPFTRFVMVFSLLRQALGLQQSPPNQVIIGLSLVLSITVMQPTLTAVNERAVQPFVAGDLDTGSAYTEAMGPLRTWMFSNTQRDSLETSIRIARISRPESLDELPATVVITAYVLSELETAFVTAVKVYIPFLVVDLVVASILLGMGMMMLPPVVISLPFKLMLFVLMDGWSLLVLGLTGANR